jgi:hypothetical protein
LPLTWPEENKIVDRRRKINAIYRYEARGALSLREFRLPLRNKNRQGTFRRRTGRAESALLLWQRHGKDFVDLR